MIGSDFMNSDELLDVIMSREWSFNDVLNMDETVKSLVQELIDNMDIETKYNIVKDTYETEEARFTVGEIISKVLRQKLSDMVSFTVNKYLKDATVNFTKDITETIKVDNEEKVDKPKEDKILSLKEQIKKDVKQLDNKEMKKKGMI